VNITAGSGFVTFAVRATPRAKQNKLGGVAGDALKVYVTAPPEDGRANEAVIEVLADALGIKRRQVEIISGPTNRNKVVRVAGVDAAAVQNLFVQS
jgi:uncharacterized protein (TIGR00251 family)